MKIESATVVVGICAACAFGCVGGKIGAEGPGGGGAAAGACEDPDAWLDGEPPLGCPTGAPDDGLLVAEQFRPVGAPDDGVLVAEPFQPVGAPDDGAGFLDDTGGGAGNDGSGQDDGAGGGAGGGGGGGAGGGAPDDGGIYEEVLPGGGDEIAPGVQEKCYWADGGDVGDLPMARAYWQEDLYAGEPAIRVRVILDDRFVDNTYGRGASDGYGNAGHQFQDLVDGDSLHVGFSDLQGVMILDGRFDYLSPDPGAASGYSALGLSGGDGELLSGEAGTVLGVTSSLADNLGSCDATEDSPAQNDGACPGWDHRVIYVIWLSEATFAQRGLAHPVIESIFASPSRMGVDTISVHAAPCRVQ